MLIMIVFKNFIKKVLTGSFLSAILFTDLKIRGRPIHAKGFVMLHVKLDMSVKGIPSSETRKIRKHFSESIDCLLPDTAIRRALDTGSWSVLADGVSSLYAYVSYVVDFNHGICTGDVSLVRRYTVYNSDGKCVMSAVFTDYFD